MSDTCGGTDKQRFDKPAFENAIRRFIEEAGRDIGVCKQAKLPIITRLGQKFIDLPVWLIRFFKQYRESGGLGFDYEYNIDTVVDRLGGVLGSWNIHLYEVAYDTCIGVDCEITANIKAIGGKLNTNIHYSAERDIILTHQRCQEGDPTSGREGLVSKSADHGQPDHSPEKHHGKNDG